MINALDRLNGLLWTGLFLPCFLLCGALLTLRCGGLQLRRFGLSLRLTVGRSKPAGRDGAVTPFQAASTALAATVGTGNIVGTAQAIAMGGPGAVFWLLSAAFLGMAIKYAEIFLGLCYRQTGADGKPLGGPMVYIRRGLGRRAAPLAASYAALAALAALGMGNLTQVNGAVSAVCRAVSVFWPLDGGEQFRLRLCLGAALALLTALILSGGAKSVGRAAERLVPLMSLAFLFFIAGVLVCHARRLPAALAAVAAGAFRPRAVLGAAGGLTLRQALIWGLRRGAFSNEAGLGSAALAHSAVMDEDPAEHGLWGIFEVFADTVVICSATALAILCSGVEIPWGTLPGPELLGAALETVYGPRLSALILSCSLFLFAFTSVLGSSVFGASAAAYLFGPRGAGCYRVLYALCTLPGSLLSLPLLWTAVDTVNVLLSLPNFIALFALSGQVGRAARARFFSGAAEPGPSARSQGIS